VERGKGGGEFEKPRSPMQPSSVDLLNGCEKFEVKSEFRHTDINS